MSRCPECDKQLTSEDDLGHDCEVPSQEEIDKARADDRRALQSLTNMIVLGNGY